MPHFSPGGNHVQVQLEADPFTYNWSDVPDTVQIYSLARPELNVMVIMGDTG